jgi:hypothetical protein
MRIRTMMAMALLAGALSAPAMAQDTTHHEQKPGGLNKVARDVSKTMKKAGRDTKAETKRTSGRVHRELTAAGHDTKAELKRATNTPDKPKDPNHKPGGLNKVARDVSHESKKVGAKAKHDVKDAKSDAHRELSKSGKDAKTEAKKVTP